MNEEIGKIENELNATERLFVVLMNMAKISIAGGILFTLFAAGMALFGNSVKGDAYIAGLMIAIIPIAVISTLKYIILGSANK